MTPNRSDAGGRSFGQRINTAWTSFLARARARTSCERDPARWAQSARGGDRHLAEVAMDIQRYRSHLALLALGDEEENRWANDIDGSALAAQTGHVTGAATEKPGLEAHRPKRPDLRSPRKPLVRVNRT